MNYKLLFIDETGKASYNHSSPLFILAGFVIPNRFGGKLNSSIKKLKKRCFQNEEIIFHGRDIARKKGPFKALQDPNEEMKFWVNIISILNNYSISIIFTIANKQNARKNGWQQATILKRSYLKILDTFATKYLTIKTNGRIIVESDPAQDFYLIKANNYLQNIGTTDKSMTGAEYQKRLTSLSLVNKSNLDVGVQLADMLAPWALLKYNIDNFEGKKQLNKIEKIQQRFIERKLLNKDNPSFFDIII